MMTNPGKLFDTDYTESDILDCISSYSIITGHNDPKEIIYRIGQENNVKWLAEFGINLHPAKIQPNTIIII